MIALLLACGDGRPVRDSTSEDGVQMADYDGLKDGSTWVYRDDGDTGTPAEDTLIRARYVGGGEVELRRGTRWADADYLGSFVWDTGAGLTLLSWELPVGTGAGSFPITGSTLEVGAVVGTGEWTCETSIPEDGESTWYGVFDAAFAFVCAGGDGLDGRYVFGEGVGLVRLETSEGYVLDLVAPW